ncbi:2-aminoethylphosphonate ABC transporter substrate-binding protein [Saccharothrix variisporea]|uniref:2-aminoethylphosphonate transport system substrate-binding protein n=1 Tax=Saccharothrix variisporea TaxID=543527 RepID=A0A495XA62_9PSEU|nr:2-aminoethylphosphonate ABC transporter substrate-binding protein [Saccharothrix variisporea]RKT69724.1 2-aminoethylphosphonate transport system substrate-binding protein [Saccharothrix variisporea]
MLRKVLAVGLLLLTAACGGTAGGSAPADQTVTVYTVDGLAGWYGKRAEEFKAKTGITVQLVESGSGEVVTRAEREKANPQADVLVTLPPFIQRAAKAGLLADYTPADADKVTDKTGKYTAVVNNYLDFIYNPKLAQPAPKSWQDLLDPRFKGKLQYSTPGQAGDGTAVLLQLKHVYGDQGALDYLAKLEANNVGPSSSTGKLQPKVSKGEIFVANGDVQMNLASIRDDKSEFEIFFPADDKGVRSTFAIPYFAGLATGAPHADNGKKFLDFLLSADVQKTIPTDALGQPTRSDVPAEGRVSELLKGVEVWQPDWTAVVESLDADVAAYTKAVGR